MIRVIIQDENVAKVDIRTDAALTERNLGLLCERAIALAESRRLGYSEDKGVEGAEGPI